MAVFIKAGFWEKLCQKCTGYKGWLNLTQFVQDNAGLPYKVYTALLNQSGGNAPVPTVLENTLGGTPVWTRGGTGYYECTLPNAFPANKTFCTVTYNVDQGNFGIVFLGRSDDDVVNMYFRLYDNSGGVDFNNSPYNDLCVEIRVYP